MARGEPDAWRDTHVRFGGAGRGTRPSERAIPRPGPTLQDRPCGRRRGDRPWRLLRRPRGLPFSAASRRPVGDHAVGAVELGAPAAGAEGDPEDAVVAGVPVAGTGPGWLGERDQGRSAGAHGDGPWGGVRGIDGTGYGHGGEAFVGVIVAVDDQAGPAGIGG